MFEEVSLPDGKAIIPGVIDSTTNYVEHPDLVAQRIERYARLVGRENVLAGSDLRVRHVRDLLDGRPAGHLGQAGGDGGRRPPGEPGAVELTVTTPAARDGHPRPGRGALGRCMVCGVSRGQERGNLAAAVHAAATRR